MGAIIMADVFVEFDTVIPGSDGTGWMPRACGRVDASGLWEGWIEFVPKNAGADAVRTQRETEQPNRDDLMYWAQGLSHVYLEDALVRALAPTPIHKSNLVASKPRFEGPAPSRATRSPGTPSHAVLNPFDVYRQGEDVLVRQLSALHAARLREIVVQYGFASANWADGTSHAELTTAIIGGVRAPRVRREPEDRATP
jgi:hypothetical protein